MSGQAAEETCRGRVCGQVVHILESRVWVILLTCDQSPLDMVRRRWPLGTPGTPAPAPPRPQGLDETLSAQRRCSERPAIGILLGPQLGGDNPILLASRVGQNCGRH